MPNQRLAHFCVPRIVYAVLSEHIEYTYTTIFTLYTRHGTDICLCFLILITALRMHFN